MLGDSWCLGTTQGHQPSSSSLDASKPPNMLFIPFASMGMGASTLRDECRPERLRRTSVTTPSKPPTIEMWLGLALMKA